MKSLCLSGKGKLDMAGSLAGAGQGK